MKALGYSVTWTTTCFIGEGCGAEVFGHTNGHGDFVLFDEPVPPWPVHECYLRRFELSSRSISMRIGGTKEFPVSLEGVLTLPRHFVSLASYSALAAKTYGVIATVVDVFETLHEWRKEMRKPRVYGPQAVLMNNQAQNTRSVVRLYTGQDEEYYALIDLRKHPVKFNDVVAVTLREKQLLDEEIFVVVECKRFHSS